MAIYQEQTGSRSECTAIDSERVLAELSRGKFVVSSSASTYIPEKYTTGYTSSIFTAKNAIEEFWNSCVSLVSSYIDKFKNVQLPETISPDTSYLNGLGAGEQVGYVISDGVSLYSKPNGDIISSLSYGAAIVATGRTADNKWIQVRLSDGTTAYVPYDSLGNNPKKSSSSGSSQTTQTQTAGNGEQIGYVIKDGTNIYSKPNGEVMATIAAGSAIVATGRTADNKWIQVRLSDGTTAYVPYDSLGSQAAATAAGITPTKTASVTPRQTTPGKGLTDGNYNGMNYYAYEPTQDGTLKPLTVFLYGNEEGGTDKNKLTKYGLGLNLKNGQEYNGNILLVQGWDTDKINSLIDKYIAENNIDPNKVSIAGYSRGASAAAELVRQNPNKFSAAAFIASSVNDSKYTDALSNIPTKFISGSRDSATDKSASMSSKLESAGGTSSTYVYQNKGHENSIVTTAYNDGLFDWLISQSKTTTT